MKNRYEIRSHRYLNDINQDREDVDHGAEAVGMLTLSAFTEFVCGHYIKKNDTSELQAYIDS
ncbi:6627_t:CDS:2 [Entrophospora sp. SA101]|nr:6627_t:CDS:2 [Entrophospora sp. SA101]